MNARKTSTCWIFFCQVVLVALLLSFSNKIFADVADYVGVYAGIYESEDGDERGILRCITKADGSIQLLSWSTVSNTGNQSTGTIDTNGNFSVNAADLDFTINGSIDDSGNITLVYLSMSEDISGTGSGQLVTRESISQYIEDFALTYYDDGEKNLWLTIYSDGMIINDDNLIEGAVGPDGKFLLTTENGAMLFLGAIDFNGIVDGYWYKPDSRDQGPMAGSDRNLDNDGDGFTENQGDCKDENAEINPGATEICGDHIDQDCNGTDLACDSDDPSGDDTSDDTTDDGIDDPDDNADKSSNSAGCFLSTAFLALQDKHLIDDSFFICLKNNALNTD